MKSSGIGEIEQVRMGGGAMAMAAAAGKRMERSARCVREDISHCASTSLSLGDLFYPPSAC